MDVEELNSYLNDHLAGSVAALELLDRLIDRYEGKVLEGFFRDLRKEIETDQETLKELMAKLGEKESAVRPAYAHRFELRTWQESRGVDHGKTFAGKDSVE